MAVKVMVAPVIAARESEGRRAGEARSTRATPRPKRRRSAIFDADGNEVFITLVCLKCHKTRPLAQFGLRKMADGAIRNQPWCRACRAAAGSSRTRAGDSPGIEDSTISAPSPLGEEHPGGDGRAESPQTGALAAEVAAALAGGRGR